MKSPFKFGKTVSGDEFTDREKDIGRLTSNISNGINTIMISPRRWGKSSLVRKVAEEISEKNRRTRFCFIDLFSIRNESEFYTNFAKEVIKSSSSVLDDWIETVKTFLGRITPSIRFGKDPLNDFEISFNLNNASDNIQDILNLSEKIASKKKITMTVCIDEFQNLENYDDPLSFQKLLRSVWQNHKNAVYCLYGSKRHMLMNLFENKSMPFYKFGDVVYLEKINRENLKKFIEQRFRKTKKSIDPELAGRITDLMECHPYYVQQLSHIVWVNTDKKATERIIDNALEDMLSQNSLLFEKETESLSYSQVNLLKALAGGIKTELSSADVINKYNLSSSANVARVKHALENKGIIDTSGSSIEFIDPAFRLWFRKVYKIN